MLGNKLILSAAIALAVTLSNPAFAQRLTGCLNGKGNIGKVQEGDVPLSACSSSETQVGWDQTSTQPMILVDSSLPARILGPVLDISRVYVLAGFEFESETYQIEVRYDVPSQRILASTSRYFSDSSCSGQEYGLVSYYTIPPIKPSYIVDTITGHSLWVASGDPVDLTVNSYLPSSPPYECVQITGNLSNTFPIRDTGFNFDVDFAPPFRLANLPTVQ